MLQVHTFRASNIPLYTFVQAAFTSYYHSLGLMIRLSQRDVPDNPVQDDPGHLGPASSALLALPLLPSTPYHTLVSFP